MRTTRSNMTAKTKQGISREHFQQVLAKCAQAHHRPLVFRGPLKSFPISVSRVHQSICLLISGIFAMRFTDLVLLAKVDFLSATFLREICTECGIVSRLDNRGTIAPNPRKIPRDRARDAALSRRFEFHELTRTFFLVRRSVAKRNGR